MPRNLSWSLDRLGKALGHREGEEVRVRDHVQLTAQVANLEGFAAPLRTPTALFGAQQAALVGELGVLRLQCRAAGGARVRGRMSRPAAAGTVRLVKQLYASGVAPGVAWVTGPTACPMKHLSEAGAGSVVSVAQFGTIASPWLFSDVPTEAGALAMSVDVVLQAGQYLDLVNATANQLTAWDLHIVEWIEAPRAR